MFGKLKEKLKQSLNIFSKQVEEEVDDGLLEINPEEELTKSEEKEELTKSEEKEELTKSEEKEELTKSEEKEELTKSEEKKELTKSEEKEELTKSEEKKGFFSRIKESISTKTLSKEKFENIFWDLEVVLLENNVSVKVIDKIKTDLEQVLVDQKLPRNPSQIIMDTLKESVNDILSFDEVKLLDKMESKPYKIMFFGINGAGKTTTIAKIVKYLQNQNKSVVVAAADTFRAAAIDQIEEHTTKLGVKLIKHDYGSDPAAVAFDAVKHAEKNGIDVVLIDTAGRLHSNTNLMGELDKIIRVAKPDLSLFVGESITGNDCVEQALQFNEVTNLDGVILSKADIDEMGGATLSISYTLQKPIYFLGVGQDYTDLIPFKKDYIMDKLGL